MCPNKTFYVDDDDWFCLEVGFELRDLYSEPTEKYLGMYNPGTTCYMNSYLQTIFFLRGFLKNFFALPSSAEDSGNPPLDIH
jgi:uncharacterized UBP type Zn finger protein